MWWFILSLAIAGTEPTSTEDKDEEEAAEVAEEPAPPVGIPGAPPLTTVRPFDGSVPAFEAMPAPLGGLPPLVGLPAPVNPLPVVGLPQPVPANLPVVGLPDLVPGLKDLDIPTEELKLKNLIEDRDDKAKDDAE